MCFGGPADFFGRIAAPGQGLQQEPCILEITPPQHASTRARQPVGAVSTEGVVCQNNPLGGYRAALAAPFVLTGVAIFLPCDGSRNGFQRSVMKVLRVNTLHGLIIGASGTIAEEFQERGKVHAE